MKYLFRFIGAFLIWPILIIFKFLGCIVTNIILFLWDLNFKNIWYLTKNDLYFLLEESSESEIEKGDEKDPDKWRVYWKSYKRYYATPKDMLLGKITKKYND
jgi:hypothetical protein